MICIILGVGTIFGFYLYVKPELPDVATLKNVELQTPMQVFSADGQLISQFGEKRRIPLELKDIPPQMLNAFIATEDSRYYEHPGIDPVLDLLPPVLIFELEAGEFLFEGEEEVLDRRVSHRIVEVHLCEGLDLRELKDGLALGIGIHLAGADGLVLLDQAGNELLELGLGYHLIDH